MKTPFGCGRVGFALVLASIAASAAAQDHDRAKQVAAEMQKRFAAADKNGDGRLTKEEAEAGMPYVYKHFDEIDKTKTGSVAARRHRRVRTRAARSAKSATPSSSAVRSAALFATVALAAGVRWRRVRRRRRRRRARAPPMAAPQQPRRRRARATTAAPVRPFYSEWADSKTRRSRRAGNRQHGPTRPLHHNDTMSIASASKWVYGDLLRAEAERRAQRRRHQVPATHQQLHQLRGAAGRPDRAGSSSMPAATASTPPGTDGKFSYGGGHMEKHASLNGLGPLGRRPAGGRDQDPDRQRCRPRLQRAAAGQQPSSPAPAAPPPPAQDPRRQPEDARRARHAGRLHQPADLPERRQHAGAWRAGAGTTQSATGSRTTAGRRGLQQRRRVRLLSLDHAARRLRHPRPPDTGGARRIRRARLTARPGRPRRRCERRPARRWSRTSPAPRRPSRWSRPIRIRGAGVMV